jgi:CheY-like chemotaxis protein
MPSILIADDEKAIRKTLEEILEYEGYRVDEAEDGQKAYDMAKDGEYDVILCDIKMPKMDGLEVLDKLEKKATRPSSS